MSTAIFYIYHVSSFFQTALEENISTYTARHLYKNLWAPGEHGVSRSSTILFGSPMACPRTLKKKIIKLSGHDKRNLDNLKKGAFSKHQSFLFQIQLFLSSVKRICWKANSFTRLKWVACWTFLTGCMRASLQTIPMSAPE